MNALSTTFCLVAIMLLGIAEQAVSLPLFAVGLILIFVRGQKWWLRLCMLLVAGSIWGTAQAISPTGFVLLLLIASWVECWLSTVVNQRVGLCGVILAVAIITSVVRGESITWGILVLLCLQSILFWLYLKLFFSKKTNIAQFFFPPTKTQRPYGTD